MTYVNIVLDVACSLFGPKPLFKVMLGYCCLKTFHGILYRWVSIFIKDNAWRNFCKMWTILSRAYCVYKLQLVASTISLFTSLMTTKWIYNVYWFYRGCPYAYMYIVYHFSTNFPVGFIFNHEHSPVSAIWTATSLFRITQHEIQHKNPINVFALPV